MNIALREEEDSIQVFEHGEIRSKTFGIHHSKTDALVGKITLRLSMNDYILRYRGHTGYTIEPEYRGRGYASEAVLHLLAIARSEKMRFLVATCDPLNIASEKVLRKTEFLYTGTTPVPVNSYLWLKGTYSIMRFVYDFK